MSRCLGLSSLLTWQRREEYLLLLSSVVKVSDDISLLSSVVKVPDDISQTIRVLNQGYFAEYSNERYIS